jgi:S1-C subfamily serine protease
MANKVIVGILIFLLILGGGLGAYSYTLKQQIEVISAQLEVYHKKQTAQIGTVRDTVTTLRGETLAGFDTLQRDVGGALTDIGTLEDEVDETLTEVGALEDDIHLVIAALSQSVINADAVYQKLRDATVGISNGEKTVGSGFVLDTLGHVVTAQHVVERLSTIYVVLSDGRSSKATVVGSSEYSDIAVLKLDADLVGALSTLADSAMVRIGEPVVTIGNPFDQKETLTSGIVSQINRFIEIEYDSKTRWVASLIQFDAAVNFGNSGGPLMNSEGEVIGMVVARVHPSDGDGIYYAVSSNKIDRVAASLIAQGSFDYPWLGVEITDLTPKFIQGRALETTNGVLVGRVLAESPAEVGGIRSEDIIIAVDAIAVRDIGDLNSYLGEHKNPGELVSLTLIRGSAELEISLKIGKR